MRYRASTQTLEATQWWKNGDHPYDDVLRPFEDTGKVPTEPREGKIVRYFRHPGVHGKRTCDFCGKTFHDHGFIDFGHGGEIVCPGNWVLTDHYGRVFKLPDKIFKYVFEPVI